MSNEEKYILMGMLRRYSYESTFAQDIENVIDKIVTGMDEDVSR